MGSSEVAVVSRVDEDEWRELLSSVADATCFQRPAFSRLVQTHAPDWSPRWVEVRRDGRLVAGMPFHLRQRWGVVDAVSGWGGSYGGPVAVDAVHRPEALAAFRDHLRRRRRRLEVVWGGHERPAEDFEPLDAACLELSGCESFEDFLMRRFPKNRRNECTRSTKRGLRVEHDPDGRHVGEVWEIYREQCGRWATSPVERGVWSGLLDHCEQASLFVALDADAGVVGGHLCVRMRDELFAWLGTTRRMDRVYPSSLLIREEARFVYEHGLARLNLGSSMGLGGVQNYKQLLGARIDRRWILRQRAWWWPR